MSILVKIIFTYSWLFFFLVFKTRRNEKILVYHSPWLSVPIRLAKFFKGFKLILEVEEIYSDVWKNEYKYFPEMEKSLIRSADNYILVSELLAETLGITEYTILYGAYNILERTWKSTCKKKTIKIIYAGSIDKLKSGATNLVEAARYLNENYSIEILGFGDKLQIKNLQARILHLNMSLKRIACKYHGVKTGSCFTSFLLSCQIGVNPQNTGSYMNAAFPSKILSYLSHDLRVVSTPVKSVIESELSDIIAFAMSDSPEDIANAIMSVDLNQPHDSRARLEQLDKQFVNDIGKLLEGG